MAFTPPDKESIHRARTFPMALALLRVAGSQTGYAIAVHGSQVRDLDVVAVPWTEEAKSAEEFIEAVREAFAHWGMTAFHSDDDHPLPRVMPHGRLCWPFHFGGGPYLDLAVMPRDVHSAFRGFTPTPMACANCGRVIELRDGAQAHGAGRTGGDFRWWHFPACPPADVPGVGRVPIQTQFPPQSKPEKE